MVFGLERLLCKREGWGDPLPSLRTRPPGGADLGAYVPTRARLDGGAVSTAAWRTTAS